MKLFVSLCLLRGRSCGVLLSSGFSRSSFPDTLELPPDPDPLEPWLGVAQTRRGTPSPACLTNALGKLMID